MIRLILFPIFLISIIMNSQEQMPSTIHGFSITTLEGETLNLSNFKGKKILIVNTASKCGFTPQYKELEKLYKTYKDRLVIIGFPANNFLRQEPGTNDEIAEFCERNYGVSFPMSEKISVKGKDMAPIYQWLTKKENNGVKNSKVTWNFNKYLIDEEGRLMEKFGSRVKPLDSKITDHLK
ncbi:MAG TPA: glutathione peroxidase [Aequorivita sp.]|nr:glutathione peroxidase [Aequorivita sp.]